MRKAIQVFLLASALFIGTASAADSTFLFGAWMYDTPRLSGTDIDSYISLLKDTLRFNTLLTTCYEQYHLDKYALHG